MAERHVGIVKIGAAGLALRLQLPAGHVIVGMEVDFVGDALLLKIEGPSMPVAQDGVPLLMQKTTYRTRRVLSDQGEAIIYDVFDGFSRS